MRTTLQNLPRLQITRFETCESTNQSLLNAAEAGASTGSVFVAREQTAGRGRRGREWVAAQDDSLTFSLLWHFPADPARLSGLSLVVGIAIVRALNEMAVGSGPTGLRCGLKWPNDLLLCDEDGRYAKMGGILIESVLRPSQTGAKELSVVIGVGLNCTDSIALKHSVRDQCIGAASELLGYRVTPEDVLPVVLKHLSAAVDQFSRDGFLTFCNEWNAHNLWQGLPVQVREGDAILQEGRCAGVDPDGALCIDTAAGQVRIISGDVSLRRV